MYIYVAKVKQGENFSIRVFKTKASATKLVKQAQETLYQQMKYTETHDTYQDANGFGVTIEADNTVGHKKTTNIVGDKTVYYVVTYSKKTKKEYYKSFAGYVIKKVIEN